MKTNITFTGAMHDFPNTVQVYS